MVSRGGGGTGWVRKVPRMRGRFFWRVDEFYYGIQTGEMVGQLPGSATVTRWFIFFCFGYLSRFDTEGNLLTTG